MAAVSTESPEQDKEATVECNSFVKDDEDDDCVLIETPVERILIEDEEKQQHSPPCSSGNINLQHKLEFSTPILPFYEDKTRNPLFNDSIANYSVIQPVLRGKTSVESSPISNGYWLNTQNTRRNSDVIEIEDTITDITLQEENVSTSRRKRKSSELDDSVVFVSETNPKQFIPLYDENVPNVSICFEN